LLTQVSHHYTDDASSGGTYFNEFTCIPTAIAYRPRQRSAKPRVHGPHTATVVGDEEIHTDEHGRIQVQFHWEEVPSNAADASCWIRCAHTWAGSGWGAQFIPRVGMEVVVEFLEGNPDRPLVTGCVYNGANPPPFEVPVSKTQSGWRTRSSPDSEGYNMLRFEDAVGQEEIHIHAQRDWRVVVEHDAEQEVRRDERLRVRRDRRRAVKRDEKSRLVASASSRSARTCASTLASS
ncbi:MAG: type VI secretion system tip protein VgrG, partial [Deltaproteobacteria bacterium]|nr:type VI secretion system tip protein VgrG [Deltaproteobacteria bacterium]